MSSLHSIDSSDLDVLCAVYRQRSVTRAAAILGCTQSAVSHQLRRLRERFDDPLFVRSGRAMQPTPLGERLVLEVEPHLNALRRIVEGPRAFDPHQSRRQFSIASIDLFDMVFLGPLMARLAEASPWVRLRVSVHDATTPARFDRGELDAAIHPLLGTGPDTLPSAGLRRRTLLDDGWSLFARQGLRIDDLDAFCAHPHVLVGPDGGPGLVDRALERVGRARTVAVRLPSFAAALPLVARTSLLLVGPSTLARLAPESVQVLPVPVPLPEHRVTLVWPERLHDDPGHRWLRQQLHDATRSSQGSAAS